MTLRNPVVFKFKWVALGARYCFKRVGCSLLLQTHRQISSRFVGSLAITVPIGGGGFSN